jgi:hypothetical protein
VIETLIDAAPPRTVPGFYRTAAGAEVDLLLEVPGGGRWAIEIKRSVAMKPARGFHEARRDLKPSRSFVVYADSDRYPIGDGVEAIGLRALAELLASLS